MRRGGFDLVVDLQRHLKSGVVGLTSGARRRIGFGSANTKEYNHLFSTQRIAPQPNLKLKLAQYQAFGDALGIAPTPIEFGLRLAPEESAKALGLIANAPRPMVAVILGSSWPSRIYPADAIARVIRELAQASADYPALFPLLIGGAEETRLAAAVMRELAGEPGLNLVGKTTLRDLIAILAECTVAFGPDSGPMHIAAAVGCPIVSLWGSTAPERSAPWGFADFAIRGEIPCHPCYLRRCPIGGECMRQDRAADRRADGSTRSASAAQPRRAGGGVGRYLAGRELTMTGDGKSLDRDGWRFQLAPATGCRAAELVERALAAASGKAGRLLRRSRNASSFRSTTGSGQVSAEVFIKVIEPPHGIDRLKTILRGSRAAHVARITEKLNTAGFAAPPVLLFGREEATGRELLLTPVVNDDGPFRALEGTPAQKRAMLRALGTELARLHRAGFIHGDLTPYNLFIARAPRFTFIDHERTRRTFPDRTTAATIAKPGATWPL